MNKKIADKILDEMHRNYDSIAESFSQTRNYLGSDAVSLLGGNLKAGDRILDIGCGNGRFFPFFKDAGADYAGIDSSEKLVAIAAAKFPEANFTVADALNLPFGANEFDLAISFAVLHHVPSKEYRLNFFKEAWRVLKPRGKFIATVWDLRPFRLIRTRQWKRFKNYAAAQIGIVFGAKKLDFGDFFIPWQNRYQRYVHAFGLRELEKLTKTAGFEIEKSGILGSGKKESNLYIIARKA